MTITSQSNMLLNHAIEDFAEKHYNKWAAIAYDPKNALSPFWRNRIAALESLIYNHMDVDNNR